MDVRSVVQDANQRSTRTASFTVEGNAPLDLLEYSAEPFGLNRVDHFQEADLTFEMGSKVGIAVAILALRTVSNTVCERCLETIKFNSL